MQPALGHPLIGYAVVVGPGRFLYGGDAAMHIRRDLFAERAAARAARVIRTCP
jgi:hypothetical protein